MTNEDFKDFRIISCWKCELLNRSNFLLQLSNLWRYRSIFRKVVVVVSIYFLFLSLLEAPSPQLHLYRHFLQIEIQVYHQQFFFRNIFLITLWGGIFNLSLLKKNVFFFQKSCSLSL